MELEGLGTRAINMGGAFIGLADDASAVYWNPAGLAWLKGGRLEMGVYTMSSTGWDRNSVSNLPLREMNPAKGDVFMKIYPSEPTKFKDSNDFWPFAAVMPAIAGYKSFDNYTFGFGIYPNLGIGTSWDDKIQDPKTFADITASFYSMVAVLNGNMSIAKRLSDKFSIGLGLEFVYVRGTMDADKNYRNSRSTLRPDYEFRLESETDGVGVQGIIGLYYRLSPKLSFGAVFKTGTRFDLNGNTSIRQTFFIQGEEQGIAEKSDHTQRFIYPPAWGIGIAYRPSHLLTLTFDWQRTDWTKFMWPAANLDYKNEGVMLKDTSIDPDWFAANRFRFGMEYLYSERLTLRAGFFFEEAGIPADGEGLTTTFAGYCKYANVGFGYRWDVWTLDIMGGTMWAETPEGVGHQ